MVMYTSDVKSHTLSLDYGYVPGAKEVIRDILSAPIEYGENFQNKKKGRKTFIVKDERIKVNAELGDKARKEVFESEELRNAGFKFATDKNNLDPAYIYVPETEYSEQSSLMG